MDANTLLLEFQHIINAPSGIQKLRELILHLAVSGRLIRKGLLSEGNTSLLDEIKVLKAQFESQYKLQRVQPHPVLTESEYPYTIPSHWSWQRLEQISYYIQRGKGPVYAQTGSTIVLSQKAIQWAGLNLADSRYIAEPSLKSYGQERFLQAGDLLWNSTGTGTAGRVVVYNGDAIAVADSHITVIRLCNFEPRYVWCVIASPWVQERMSPKHRASIVSGSTNQIELSTTSVRALAIPCPPLEEQLAIVAKVDELMVLCDKLETLQRDKQLLCNNTRKSVLNSLISANSTESLLKAWIRVNNNINSLLNSKSALNEWGDAIKFLGCRGLLTESIELDSFKLYKDNIPLPIGWKWAKLNELTDYITSGSRGWKQYLAQKGDIFIRSQDIRNDLLSLNSTARVDLPVNIEGKRSQVQHGDLLMTITGANVGKCAKVTSDIETAYVSQHIALIRLKDKSYTEFLHWWLTNSYGGRSYLSKFIYGDKPGLSLAQVGSIPIPLPPTDAKDRIVEKLTDYNKIVSNLLIWIESASILAEELAATVIKSITGVEKVIKEEMNNPKPILVSLVRLGTKKIDDTSGVLASIIAENSGAMSTKDLWQSSPYKESILEFYQQLKLEVSNGWIAQPDSASIKY